MIKLKEQGITLIAKEEIVKINGLFEKEGDLVSEGDLDFILSKVRSKRLSGKRKKDLANLAGTLWFGITTSHPFFDGNKRTATASMLYFLQENNSNLNVKKNNLIYLSLKMANKDIAEQQIIEWIMSKIKV
ncbi:MAG: type II toxin-antitoxin system death-on-curing family toxin [Candidatus Aenigmarchaeota archaeon]|nr:type II toxin-antitoxin system death-on-curing family toxin [Candidatus Aenigmarchaeota archaeon]